MALLILTFQKAYGKLLVSASFNENDTMGWPGFMLIFSFNFYGFLIVKIKIQFEVECPWKVYSHKPSMDKYLSPVS